MQPQLFSFKGQQVRTVTIDNEAYFVGKDVADILGYANNRDALVKHVDDEDKQTSQIATAGQKRSMTVINESGLYSLILGSKLPQAHEFKRWVTSEVLPTIRKHGAYMTPAKIEEVLTDPDTIIQLATQLKEEQQKRKRLQEENEVMKPKALFADAVSTAKTNILIGEMAKILKANGVDYITVAGQKVTMGQNHFFQWLRENGYLIKRRGTDYNAPTQMAMNKGLFKVKESTSIDANGTTRVNKTTKVTGKGQQYFTNYFLAA